MAFDITGKLYKKFDTVQVSERFTKREFVLEVADGKYPQFVSFQATGDRCSALDPLIDGEELRVTFNLRGREWRNPQGEVKYFNSLDVWKLDRLSAPKATETARGGAHDPAPTVSAAVPEDEIPF